MGKRDKRELTNQLTILIAHLLKWRIQPEPEGLSAASCCISDTWFFLQIRNLGAY
jgi:hypothetical protein